MADIKNRLKKYPIALIIVGTMGLAITGVFLVSSYRSANKVINLVGPLIYGFIPFVISFLLFKLGINVLMKREK